MFDEDGSGAPADGPAATPSSGDKPAQLAQAQLAQAPGDPIGTVEELTGSVTLTRADGSSTTAAPGDPVYLDDVVSTATGSSVEIRFVDDTRFSLGQNGQMTLDTLVYNPGGDGNELDLSVVQGAFTFVTGAIAGAPGEGMEVRVPVGTIGIRGTAVGGGPDATTADPSDYTIVLLPEAGGRVGRIVLTDLNGRSVILDVPLEAMDISSLGLAPGEPVQLTREQVIDLLGGAVENIEDILDIILNFESPEEENPEAGPQEGELIPSVPNNGGIRTQLGENQTLDELTTLFTLSDEQGFGSNQPVGGFTPTGGLGGSQGGQQGGDDGDNGPQQTFDPVTIDDSSGLTVITGTDEGEVLDGSGGGPAQIVGLAGDDELIGSSGNDILLGGDGDDILDAGAGDDQVFGQGGNDLIIGGSGEGNDALDGGAGIDTVTYASATQPITVNLTAGTASGDPAIGSDTLVNIENVIGGQAGDIIIGNSAANTLNGGGGNDFLGGQGGNDTLIGGSGTDTALFSGNLSDYLIVSGAEGGIVVTDLRADGDGVDTLTGIEFLSFADQTVSAEGANDTLATAQVIARSAFGVEANPDLGNPALPSVAITGAIFQNDDMDFFQVAMQAGEKLILDVDYGMNFGVSVDSIVTIYDAQGDVLAANDDADTSNGGGGSFHRYDAYLEFTVPADGVYYISVTSYSNFPSDGGVPSPGGGGSAGDYVLNVSIQPTEGSTGLGGAGNGAVSDADQGLINTNDPPVAVDDSGDEFVTEEDEPLVIHADLLTANDSDPDGDTPFVISVGGAVGGTVALGIENLITFTPAPNYSGPASFTYTLSDGNGGIDTATVNLTVTPANDAPTDIALSGNTVAENAAGAVIGTLTVTDPDANDTHTLTVSDDRFEIVNGELRLKPDKSLDFESEPTVILTVTATDAGGLSTSQAFAVTVTNANDAPIAINDGGDEFVTEEDEPFVTYSDQLTLNDTDADGDQPFVIGVGDAVGGTVALGVESSIIFTPTPNYNGPASFTYAISDGHGGEATATVNLTVTPANDAPTGPVDADGEENIISRNSMNGSVVGVTALATDPEGDQVTYSLTSSAGGIFAIDAVTGVVTLVNQDLLASVTASTLSITVVATDGTDTSAGETFDIAVTNGGTNGDDYLIGTEFVDELDGQGGDDTIVGLEDNDTLYGGTGDDVLVGGEGNDALYGGDGDDALFGGPGYDYIDGGNGSDFVSYSDAEDNVDVDLAGGEEFDGTGGLDTLISIENVIGSQYDDTIYGDNNDNLLIGGGGVDEIYGAGGNDIIVIEDESNLGPLASLDGGEGNDTLLFAGEGIDISLSDGLPIHSIERIDITGGGANSIALSAADVLGISDVDTLVIFGDDDDTVTLTGGGWHPSEETSIDGVQCFRYDNDNGAQVFVDTEILNQNIS